MLCITCAQLPRSNRHKRVNKFGVHGQTMVHISSLFLYHDDPIEAHHGILAKGLARQENRGRGM